MRGAFISRDLGYLPESDELWAPKRWMPVVEGFHWPPRSVRRAIKVAERPADTRRRRRARRVLYRTAARYGLNVTVTR